MITAQKKAGRANDRPARRNPRVQGGMSLNVAKAMLLRNEHEGAVNSAARQFREDDAIHREIAERYPCESFGALMAELTGGTLRDWHREASR